MTPAYLTVGALPLGPMGRRRFVASFLTREKKGEVAPARSPGLFHLIGFFHADRYAVFESL